MTKSMPFRAFGLATAFAVTLGAPELAVGPSPVAEDAFGDHSLFVERSALAQSLTFPAEELQTAVTSANAEVMVVHATEGAKFIDPALGNVPQLEQLPFKYNNFRLLDKKPLRLEKGRTADEIKLVNGGSLFVTLNDVKDGRFHVNLNLQKGGNGMNFVASQGVPFFVAGQPYKGGVLVIGVTVRR